MSDLPNIPDLAGFRLRSVQKNEAAWLFAFTEHMAVTTESPWRFIHHDHVVVTAADHRAQFGLSVPVDAALCVMSAIEDTPIQFAHIDKATGDLFVYFSANTFLQFLQMSGGHEAWRLARGDTLLICSGGGKIAEFNGHQKRLSVLPAISSFYHQKQR